MRPIPQTALFGLLLVAFTAAPANAARVWVVGDGASAAVDADDQVAAMIASSAPDAFLYLGDVYETGTEAEYELGYEPGYGRLKAITKPTPGNHEWANRATGYDAYWGAGFTGPHYYSFDLSGWHLVALNSEEAHGEGSAQMDWLRSDLAGRSGNCNIVFSHRPPMSASSHGDEPSMAPVLAALGGRTTLAFFGHDHGYQRFRPVDGLTTMVVGTGGRSLYPVNETDGRLAASRDDSFGAVELALTPGRAEYRFVALGGATLDQGTVTCQGAASGEPSSDTQAPRLTGLRAGGTRSHLRRIGRRPVLRFRLSEAANVSVSVFKRRIGGPVRLVGSFSHEGQEGSNKVSLARRMPRRLGLGHYRVTLTAVDAAGNRAEPRSVRLRIQRPY